jgi:hypothetical protein
MSHKTHIYTVVGGFYLLRDSGPATDFSTLRVFENSVDAMNYAAELKQSYDWSKSLLVPLVS